MMLASRWTDQDPTGWLLSEKLDGWRAFWDGYKLRTRSWLEIPAPASITSRLPEGIALDGELWAGRGGFLTIQSLGNMKRSDDPRWSGVRFMVFDAPTTAKIAVEERLAVTEKLARECGAGFVAQRIVKSRDDMLAEFASVVKGGGEGLVLRKPASFYEFGRSPDWLKVKPRGVD